MTKLLLKLILVVIIVGLAGCGTIEKLSGKERIEDAPPMSLKKIDSSVVVQRNWVYKVGAESLPGHVELVPAIEGDALFVAAPNGIVSSVDAATGKTIWRVDLDHPISGAIGAGAGVVSLGTPEGIVVSLDADTGEQIWTQKLSSEILAPPAVNSGMVVVRTIDGHVYGLSASDGEQRWVFHRQVPTLTLRGNSAPLIVRGAVLAGFANGKVVTADLADGSILWDITVAQPRGRNEVERMIDIDSTPVLVGSVLYVSAFQGAITALALGSRKILWSEQISSYSHIGADDENIYITDDEGKLLAMDRLTGEVVWEQANLLRRSLSGPSSVKDYVLVSDFDGYLHVIRKSDGELVGRSKFSGGRLTGTPVVHNNIIYAMTQGGSLVSISLNDSS